MTASGEESSHSSSWLFAHALRVSFVLPRNDVAPPRPAGRWITPAFPCRNTASRGSTRTLTRLESSSSKSFR